MDYNAVYFLVSRLPPYRTRSNGIEFQPNYPGEYVYEKSVVDVGLNPYDPYETHMQGDFVSSKNAKVFLNVEIKRYMTFKEARNRFLERCRISEDENIPLGVDEDISVGDIAAGDPLFLDFVRSNIVVRIEAIHADSFDTYSVLPMAEELDRQIIASMGLTPETLESGYAKPPNMDIKNVVAGTGGFAVTIDEKNITITGYYGTLSQVSIPDHINTLPVTAIGEWAFYEKGLRAAAIPHSVTAIGEWAFMSNYLRVLDLPPGLGVIGSMAFYNNFLTEITIPNSVGIIGKEAFCGNKLTRATLPNRIVRIDWGVFADNALTELLIPDSVTDIGDSAFAVNRLSRIVIPDSVTVIRDRAFRENPLLFITMPANVKLPADKAYAAFDKGFDEYYTQNGAAAGAYRLGSRGWKKA